LPRARTPRPQPLALWDLLPDAMMTNANVPDGKMTALRIQVS